MSLAGTDNVILHGNGRSFSNKTPANFYYGGNEMPQTNRKSSLEHWYATVLAPDFPRDQNAHSMELL